MQPLKLAAITATVQPRWFAAIAAVLNAPIAEVRSQFRPRWPRG